MYCPKCGAEMVRKDSHYYCEIGEMNLSQFVSSLLENEFFSGARTSNGDDEREAISLSTKGTWFCPADSSKLTGDQTPLACPQCGGTLTSQILYHLIERHPHRPDEF